MIPSQSLNMLIITEDQNLFNTINQMWAGTHLCFSPVKAGNVAIDHLKTVDLPYDIILIDSTAPTVNEGGSVGSAIELTKYIRAAWPASSVIVITDQDRQPGIEALNAGAFDYIDKSVLEQELPFRVRQIGELQRLREI